MSDINNDSVLAKFFEYNQLSPNDFYDKRLFPGLEVPARQKKLLEAISALEVEYIIIRQDITDAGSTWKISDQGIALHQSKLKPSAQNTIIEKRQSKPLITPIQKDHVLTFLVQNAELESISGCPVNPLLKDLEIGFEAFNAIMNQFQRLGFLKDLNISQSNVFFTLLVEAHDFNYRGGFVAQEEILKTQLEKLMYELEKLQKDLGPDYLEKTSKIAGIMAAIASVMPFIVKQ